MIQKNYEHTFQSDKSFLFTTVPIHIQHAVNNIKLKTMNISNKV